jgi:hypothetical protein
VCAAAARTVALRKCDRVLARQQGGRARFLQEATDYCVANRRCALDPALEYFLSKSQWVEAQAGNIDAAYVKLIDAIREPTRAAPPSLLAVAPRNVSCVPCKPLFCLIREHWIAKEVPLSLLASRRCQLCLLVSGINSVSGNRYA